MLVSKAPVAISIQLASAIPALQAELELFERWRERNVSFRKVQMSPTCHAYVQFMLATAYGASFEEGFTLLYGAEKAYFESWSRVRENLKTASPWQPFIERWSGQAFQHWVGWIEVTLDELASEASPALRGRMNETFLLTGQYELLFWNMSLQEERWPA